MRLQPPPLHHSSGILESDIRLSPRLSPTLEPLRDSRSPNAGPNSSGDEDARGYKRRSRIWSQGKKELAANICHVELQARGRDKF